MIYLLVAYMWLFIHRPFEIWPWLGELRIERVFMLVTLACWAVNSQKTWNSNRINIAVLAFGAALLISNVLSPFTEPFDKTIQDWFKIVVFFVLLITTVKTERDLKIVAVAFLVISGLYMAHSFREFLSGRHVFRMGIARMVGVDSSLGDPNSFGASIVYSLPMMIPVWKLCRKRWQYLAVIGYGCLATGCVMLTGSRSSFIGLISVFAVLTLGSKYRWKALTGLAIAAPLVWSLTTEDLQNRYLTILDPSVGPENAQVSADSRWVYFQMAQGLFAEYPLTGVGPQGFPAASGTGQSSHSIYAQLVGEAGIVGISAFPLLLSAYYFNWRGIRRLAREGFADPDGFLPAISYAVVISVILLLILGFAGHNLLRFNWLWYGAFQAIAFCLMRQRAAQFGKTTVHGSESHWDEANAKGTWEPTLQS